MRNLRTSCYLSRAADGLLSVGCRLLLDGSAHARFAFTHRNVGTNRFLGRDL